MAFRSKISVKESREDYEIFAPSHKTIDDIREICSSNYFLVLSIDIGIKNFAMSLESRRRDAVPLIIYCDRFDFRSAEKTTSLSGEIFENCLSAFNDLFHILRMANLILIERQLATNYKASRLLQHVLTYFLTMMSVHESFNPIVVIVSPKMKGKLGAGKLSGHDLKKWSIEACLQLLDSRQDYDTKNIILGHKGRTKTKADDICDAILQAHSFLLYCV